MPATPFVHVHRVTYAECTLGNHVYHSRYLDILEAARGEFFRALGHPLLAWQERGVLFPILLAALIPRLAPAPNSASPDGINRADPVPKP